MPGAGGPGVLPILPIFSPCDKQTESDRARERVQQRPHVLRLWGETRSPAAVEIFPLLLSSLILPHYAECREKWTSPLPHKLNSLNRFGPISFEKSDAHKIFLYKNDRRTSKLCTSCVNTSRKFVKGTP